MKYATLAMVATAAATPPVWKLEAAHAAKCADLTKTETSAVHVANLSTKAKKLYLEAISKDVTAETKDTKTALAALDLCYTKASPVIVKADAKAPTVGTDPCATEWNTW
jgi:microcystin degradation protein MlrC